MAKEVFDKRGSFIGTQSSSSGQTSQARLSAVPNHADNCAGAGITGIDRTLREMYDWTLNEPVPERFFELLRQIDEKMAADAASHEPVPAAPSQTD